jgi:hypothetical protein
VKVRDTTYSGGGTPAVRRAELENLPRRAGMRHGREPDYRRRRSVESQAVTHIARFLHRQVGRRWADVQAGLDRRIRELPCDEVVRQHVRDWLRRGLLTLQNGWGCLLAAGVRLWLDPATGEIRSGPPPHRRRPPPDEGQSLDELRREPEVFHTRGKNRP